MNNWRLLLLAVVVVAQPIGSFTESNLIDGRECCERSEEARLHENRKTDERRSLDGNREDRRTTNEERRLRSLHGIREERHYENIYGSNSPELSQFTEHRLTRELDRSGPLAQIIEAREGKNHNRDESRNNLGQNERDSRESRFRNKLGTTRTIKDTRNTRDTRSVERESRNTVSRLQIRNSRSIEERRASPYRETAIQQREQEDIARFNNRRESRVSAPARFDSRIQIDDNWERRISDRRTQEEGTKFRRSRYSDSSFHAVRVAQAQRTVEQSERNNRDSRVVRVEPQRQQRNTEFGNRISVIRGESERTFSERVRDENTRHTRNRMDIRVNERIDGQSDKNRRSMDTLQNIEEQRLGARQVGASRSLDMTTSNVEQKERRLLSMDILSRASERNIRNERAARIRVFRDESLEDQMQERLNNPKSRDRTSESRRIVSLVSPEKQKQQREVRAIEQSQESRMTVTRRDVREPSEERRQANRPSKYMTERMQESRRTVRESPEQRMLQHERNRLARDETISMLHEVRDNTAEESPKGDMYESLERRQRVNNRLSSNRVSMPRTDRETQGSTERAQESRRVVSQSQTNLNFRKLNSKSRQEFRHFERSDLTPRQVLQQSTLMARVTNSISAERRNYAHETFRAPRSAERSRIHEEYERQQTHDQDRTIEQRATQKEDRTYSLLLQRVTRNKVTPERSDSRRSSRPENIRLERLVRNRVEIKVNERQETQRNERDDDRTRIISSRRSNEGISTERRQNQVSSKDSRKVRTTRVVERRQENRAAEDSRIVREATNPGEVRSERMLADRRTENRGSPNVQKGRQMDATRYSRERFLQRESRAVIERFNEMPLDSIAPTDARNTRAIINNERQTRLARNLNAGDTRLESKRDVRANKYLTRNERIANDGERKETRFRSIDAVAIQDSLVQDSDEPVVVSNWQMVFYMLQGVYLCGLLMQMLAENANKSKKRTFNWWSSSKYLIKMD